VKALTDNSFKKIVARRDAYYDGRFYYGVKTTGIYCRPICPARPKPQNIVVFRRPSDAERAGYRACRRCRPELAPGHKMPDLSERLVARALRWIRTTSADELDIRRLVGTFGVTDRHLRRLFEEYLGASPIKVLTTQRLRLAKRLIQETAMPITEIALAVGFQSIRRFNEAFKGCYRTSPTALRLKENQS